MLRYALIFLVVAIVAGYVGIYGDFPGGIRYCQGSLLYLYRAFCRVAHFWTDGATLTE